VSRAASTANKKERGGFRCESPSFLCLERKADAGYWILDAGKKGGSSILDKGKDNAKTEIRDSRIAENPGTGIREP
jgi:hypothetical protein